MKKLASGFLALSFAMLLPHTSSAADTNNTLTAEEKAAGWKLLFDGTSFKGWHNFHTNTIAPGWRITDGALVCANPEQAGDIVTDDQYNWFELELDYNITDGGNSGILYHVLGERLTWPTWATGPEFQLLDNVNGTDGPNKEGRQLSGWLYGLYQPPNDPKTGKPLDATKPAGEWNHIRLLVTPEKCEHDVNGIKYFEYVLHSDDFNARVDASKFAKQFGPIPYAQSNLGSIALQGDHGMISFRNIKIRPIAQK